jgi:release factor glutamine methyltransferase
VAESTTWRALFDDAVARLDDRTEARRLVEEASGFDISQALDRAPTARTAAHFDAMLEWRAAGEPLQYVLGSWGFRTLDVFVDGRVLIPRPETEVVVEHALSLIDEVGARVVVDLGTGSGAIALSLAVERPGLAVWATDVSRDALDVARANLAGIGRAAARVRLAEGDWFDALPSELAGTIDVVVANPPYVGEREELPADVAGWEPRDALIAGPSGLEAVAAILAAAPAWLAPGGGVVLEIGETQHARVLELAEAFGRADVRPDLAGRPRALVARLSTAAGSS